LSVNAEDFAFDEKLLTRVFIDVEKVTEAGRIHTNRGKSDKSENVGAERAGL
jgi:hypothetical protein